MKGYYYEFMYDYMAVDGNWVVDFFRNVSETFVPKKRSNEANDLNDKSLSKIKGMDFEYKSLLIYDADGAFFNVSSGVQDTIEPRLLFTIVRFSGKKAPLSDTELSHLLGLKALKIAFECDTEYHFRQTTDNPSSYLLQNLDHSRLPKYYHKFLRMEMIDVSQNPGREIILPGIKFIAAYKIWFGAEATELLGRERIMNFPDAVSVKAYNQEVIEMQLWDKLEQSDSAESQRRQLSVRKYFELDKLEIPKYFGGE